MGEVVAIGERDCSIQRRHQKLVEESPAPGLAEAERRALHDAAVRIARAATLTNAATAEFLRGPDGSTYFLEVNTRLQVEHGVTELVTGLDLVREQFSLAAGEPLSRAVRAAAERAATPTGHAIEVRLTAEDPSREFSPTPGRIRHWVMPAGPGVRVDTGLGAGDRIPPEYDNLMAKIMVVGADRAAAIERLRHALDATEVAGLQTTLPFHHFVARHAGFARGDLATSWVAGAWDGPAERARHATAAAEAAAAAFAAASADGTRAAPAPTGWLGAARDEAIDRWPA
jgi:acetyl-CoA/propionyl-CoA carboxylase biotin carboxyl carrier protein